jgi:hypothetical protein
LPVKFRSTDPELHRQIVKIRRLALDQGAGEF